MKFYADAVRRLYEQCRDSTRQLTERMAVGAAVMVARLFPPANADETLQVLVALNLLNAFVKQPDGSLIVTYRYIKGMATQLLIFLLERPIEGVEVYMNTSEGISYFRALGVQISFHYLPFYRRLVRLLPIATANPQSWDGLQLQEVAAEMMARFCPEAQDFTPEEAVKARWAMLHYRPKSADRPKKEQSPRIVSSEKPAEKSCQSRRKAKGKLRQRRLQRDRWLPFHQPPKFLEDRWESLQAALTLRPWSLRCFMLYRRKDHCLTPFILYDGTNYHEVMNYLIGSSRRIVRPAEDQLQPGRYYFLSRLKQVTWVSDYWKVLFLTQNTYLKEGRRYRNLCITYSLACYLALRFPSLRFVCTLNFNRQLVQPKFYTLSRLESIPPHSSARQLKVWLVIDKDFQLKGFDAATLPQHLIDEYMEAEDYYAEYEIVAGPDGRKGIYAYRRHWLLPPMYRDILIRNYYAYVTGENGRQAIYSLAQECFVSDFVYLEVYYDTRLGAIIGRVDGAEKIVYMFDLWPSKY